MDVCLTVPYNEIKDGDFAYHVACGRITPAFVNQFNIKSEISYSRSDRKIYAKGIGFTLRLHFLDDKCEVGLKLSFFLKPFKKMILESVKKHLETFI